MSDEIDRLWALRELDEQLVTRLAALGAFPAVRAEMESRSRAESRHVEALKAKTAALQLKRRELEREITTVAEQERKFQSQLPAVKKNEEYTALLHEIEGAKRKRSDLETSVLMQMEEEEQLAIERPAAEQALKRVEADNATRLTALDTEARAVEEAVATLEGRRAAELQHLTPLVRSRYERIRSTREGRAVVPIQRGSCGGCFRTQPPQVIQEARRRDRVLLCDGCGRMLVWPPEGAAQV